MARLVLLMRRLLLPCKFVRNLMGVEDIMKTDRMIWMDGRMDLYVFFFFALLRIVNCGFYTLGFGSTYIMDGRRKL